MMKDDETFLPYYKGRVSVGTVGTIASTVFWKKPNKSKKFAFTCLKDGKKVKKMQKLASTVWNSQGHPCTIPLDFIWIE